MQLNDGKGNEGGVNNLAFVSDEYSKGQLPPPAYNDFVNVSNERPLSALSGDGGEDDEDDATPGRANWDSPIEFLLSCIAMSVGLGNVWRYTFELFLNHYDFK